MTTIQILRQEYKLLLESHDIIMDCAFYRNCQLELLFRDQEFNTMKVTLGNLLSIWMNCDGKINNERVYLVSARLDPVKNTGLGINKETGVLMTGALTFNSQNDDDVFFNFRSSSAVQYIYVPLNFIIVELQSGRKEYLKTVEEINNTFFSQLSREAESQRQTLGEKIQLDQVQEKFIINITIPIQLKEIMERQADNRTRMKAISTFQEHIKYSLGKFGFEEPSFVSNKCRVKKIFLYPSVLLKEETVRELILAVSTLENIINDITNKW